MVDSALPLGARAVQSAHVLREFAARFPEVECEWWQHSNTLVLLEAPAAELERVERTADARGIPCARFVEPDYAPGGTLTALCLGPTGKRLTRALGLLGG